MSKSSCSGNSESSTIKGLSKRQKKNRRKQLAKGHVPANDDVEDSPNPTDAEENLDSTVTDDEKMDRQVASKMDETIEIEPEEESTSDVSTTTTKIEDLKNPLQEREENGSGSSSNVEGLSKGQKRNMKKKLITGTKDVPIPKHEDKTESQGAKKKIMKQNKKHDHSTMPKIIEIEPEGRAVAGTSTDRTRDLKNPLQKRVEHDETSKKSVSQKLKALSKGDKKIMRKLVKKAIKVPKYNLVPESLNTKDVEGEIGSGVTEGAKEKNKKRNKNDDGKEDRICKEKPQPRMPDVTVKTEDRKSPLQKIDQDDRTSGKSKPNKHEGLSKAQRRNRRKKMNKSAREVLENDSLIVKNVEDKIESKVPEGAKKEIKKLNRGNKKNLETISEENSEAQMLEASQTDPEMHKIEIVSERISSTATTSIVDTATIESPLKETDGNGGLINIQIINRDRLSKGQRRRRRKREREEASRNDGQCLPTKNETAEATQSAVANPRNENILETVNLDLTGQASTSGGAVSSQIPKDVEDTTEGAVGGGETKKVKQQDSSKDEKQENTASPSVKTSEVEERQPQGGLPPEAEFSILFHCLNDLLETVPFDIDEINETVAAIYHHFPKLGVRSLRPLYIYGSLIKSSVKAHENYSEGKGQNNLHKYFNLVHIHKKTCLQMRFPEDTNEMEEGILQCFQILMNTLIDAVFSDVCKESEKTADSEFYDYCQTKTSSEASVWLLKRQGCVSNAEEIMCEVLHRLTCDDEIIEVADAIERRFYYDGSYYYQNCKSWQNFRDLYLNGEVLAPSRGQSLMEPPDEHLVIADFTTNPRYLRYYGNYLEFWQHFETLRLNHGNLKKDNLKFYFADLFEEPEFVPSEASSSTVLTTTSPQVFNYSEGDDSNRTGASISDDILNTLENSPACSDSE